MGTKGEISTTLNYLLDKYFKYAEQIDDQSAFIVFKGMPLSFLLQFSEKITFYSNKDKLFCQDYSKIDIDFIFENEFDLIANIRNKPPKKSLILYEEFLIIIKNKELLKSKFSSVQFHLISNNLFDEYPNESNHNAPDFENNSESNPQTDEDEVFNYFYFYNKGYGNITTPLLRYNQIETEKLGNIHHQDIFIPSELDSLILKPIEDKSEGLETIDWSNFFPTLAQHLFFNLPIQYDSTIVREPLEDSLKFRMQITQSIFFANSIPFNFYLKGPVYPQTFRPEILSILQNHWGKEGRFRDLLFYEKPYFTHQAITISQGAIIEFVITQAEKALSVTDNQNIPFQNIFLTAPTGSGKSILFQIPALYLARFHPEKPVTIVILPLIALIHDMIDNLTRQEISECTYIDSTITYSERAIRFEQVQQGEKSLLFLSPELFMAFQNLNFLGNRKLGLLVIDESHTVCTWGKEFRSDYWNLGRYVQRIKKFNYEFPVFALTATAIYGGDNDMVREIIRSLKIDYPEPQLYIGNVRRDYIEFQVKKFNMVSGPNYETEKKECTKNKIEYYVQNNIKSIVYFPWVRTLRDVNTRIMSTYKQKVAVYFGQLQPFAKDLNVQRFIRNEISTILATKAFGMGVDITDVMNIYHHAPSGSFSDYIQEIGRLRKQFNNSKEIIKYAETDYGYKDLEYSKKLFFLSSVKQYQIRLAIQKINALFKSRKTQSRNFLISLDDFAFVFDEPDDDKTRRMLIMIEEDLWPYLIIRPRTLFSSVYAYIPDSIKIQFINKYGAYAQPTGVHKQIGEVFSIQLDKIWELFFSKKTFPEVKWAFFQKQLFSEFLSVNENHPEFNKQQVYPQLKLNLEFTDDANEILNSLQRHFEYLQRSVYNIGTHYFTKKRLDEELQMFISDEDFRSRFSDLVLNIFSHQFGEKKPITIWKWVYRNEEKEYLTDFADFLSVKDRILYILNSLTSSGQKSISRFIAASDEKNAVTIKTLYLIEFLNCGTYSLSGGENPMVFVRVNDPDKLDRIASNPNYNNKIVSDLYRKHKYANDVFNHFFTQLTDNGKRWDFIENYFLGKDVLSSSDDMNIFNLKVQQPSGTNNGAQLAAFYRVFEQVGQLPESTILQIDFEDVDFVMPSFILPLTIIIDGLRQKGVQVKLINVGPIANYLQTIQFEYGGRILAINDDIQQIFDRFQDKNYIGIIGIPLSNQQEYLKYSEHVLGHFKKVLIAKMQLPMEIQLAVHYLISEIFDNILQHSGSNKLWIFAQYYENSGNFDIVIVDSGKGILNSYLQHGFDEVTTDKVALIYAINGNSTKDYYNERGKGLSSSRKMITKGLNGDIIVISGSAMFYNDRIINTPVAWLGTMIIFRLPKIKVGFNYTNFID